MSTKQWINKIHSHKIAIFVCHIIINKAIICVTFSLEFSGMVRLLRVVDCIFAIADIIHTGILPPLRESWFWVIPAYCWWFSRSPDHRPTVSNTAEHSRVTRARRQCSEVSGHRRFVPSSISSLKSYKSEEIVDSQSEQIGKKFFRTYVVHRNIEIG